MIDGVQIDSVREPTDGMILGSAPACTVGSKSLPNELSALALDQIHHEVEAQKESSLQYQGPTVPLESIALLPRRLGSLGKVETGHPPTYYIPPEDVRGELLRRGKRRSLCEWKGQARYFDLEVRDRRSADAAWSYPNPTPAFLALRDYIAFYPGRTDGCYVDGEKVKPQPGSFYGGWITADIQGPFKGEP